MRTVLSLLAEAIVAAERQEFNVAAMAAEGADFLARGRLPQMDHMLIRGGKELAVVGEARLLVAARGLARIAPTAQKFSRPGVEQGDPVPQRLVDGVPGGWPAKRRMCWRRRSELAAFMIPSS